MGMVRNRFAAWMALSLLVVAGIGFWVWRQNIRSDRNYKLEVLAPIVLLKNPPQAYPESNDEVGRLLPGETVEVLQMGYGKDFRAWNVKGSTNQTGWFVDDGKNVRVSKKSP